MYDRVVQSPACSVEVGTVSSTHFTAELVCVAPTNFSWCRTFPRSHVGATSSALTQGAELKEAHRIVAADQRSSRLLSPLDFLSKRFGFKCMREAGRCTGHRQPFCRAPKKPHDVCFSLEVDAHRGLHGVLVDALRAGEYYCKVALAERVRHGLVHRLVAHRYGMGFNGVSRDGMVAHGGGFWIQSAGIVGCCGRSGCNRPCVHIDRVDGHRPRTSRGVYSAVGAEHVKTRECDWTIAKLHAARVGPAQRTAVAMTSSSRGLEPYPIRYLQFRQHEPLCADARSVECLTGTSKDSQHGQRKPEGKGIRGQGLNSTSTPYQCGLSFVVWYTCSIEHQVKVSSPLPCRFRQATGHPLWRKNATPHESVFRDDRVAHCGCSRFQRRPLH